MKVKDFIEILKLQPQEATIYFNTWEENSDGDFEAFSFSEVSVNNNSSLIRVQLDYGVTND